MVGGLIVRVRFKGLEVGFMVRVGVRIRVRVRVGVRLLG
jgi:hypothetical protein